MTIFPTCQPFKSNLQQERLATEQSAMINFHEVRERWNACQYPIEALPYFVTVHIAPLILMTVPAEVQMRSIEEHDDKYVLYHVEQLFDRIKDYIIYQRKCASQDGPSN